MTTPDLPAEAIEAAHEATSCRLGEPGWTDLLYKSPQQLIDIALAAAAPVIAAQAAAAERERIREASDGRFAGWYVVPADLLRQDGDAT